MGRNPRSGGAGQAASYKKGGTTKVAGVMKSGGAAKTVKPVKKYQGGGGSGKGLFDKIKDTQETLKKTPSSETGRDLENYKLAAIEREKMKNLGVNYGLKRGLEKSILNWDGMERANEVDNLMLKNARKFRPASKTGGAIGKAKPTMKKGGSMKGKKC
jgi:hypothetical protein